MRAPIAGLALAAFLPLAGQAQECTAEQKEIWEFEKACWAAEEENLEAGLACLHEDFITQRWTDVVLKEGDTWTWIADHGGSVGDD